MPSTLEVVEFSQDTRHLVQGFDCGDEPWSLAASQWIKAPPDNIDGALHGIANRGNSVWLYYLRDRLVGFGSLGENEWPDLPPDGDRERFSYVPQLAIDKDFHSCPKDCDISVRFSHQIMADLIARALLTQNYVLGLQVHELNAPAIKLYRRFDFYVLGKRRDHVRMVRLLR